MAVNLGLTLENFKWIARELNCEPEMVIAFSKVECRRPPFDADGFPAILFERHVFYRNLPSSMRAKVARDHPDICAKQGYGPGGYGTYASQRARFSKAFAIHADAAMEACSWGAFQELGENWDDYGFDSVGEFVDHMKDGLYGQCVVFIKSIKHRGLVGAMQTRSYVKLASNYNGAGYRKYKYDIKLKNEYTAAKAKKTDWSKIKSVPPPRSTKKVAAIEEEVIQDQPVVTPQEENVVSLGDTQVTPTEEKVVIAPDKEGTTEKAAKMVFLGFTVPPILATAIRSVTDLANSGYVDAKDIGNFLLSFLEHNLKWVLILVGLLIVLMIVKKVVKQVTFWIELLSHAIPTWNSVTVIPSNTKKK